MRPQGIIGRNRAGDQFGVLGCDPRINMVSVVAVRSTVESAVAHCGHVIGYQIAAQFVTFIHRCP